jgi:predicted acetylornithine/succinylornithine family transaminase
MTTPTEIEDTYTSGVYSKRAINIVKGQDATLWDEEGHSYIDCTSSLGVANIGYGRLEVAEALAIQARQLISCSELFYNTVRGQLLQRLAQVTPEHINNFFLCNSGTEAIEGALKIARLVTGRTGIVATLRGYHGRTMGALSTTWEPHYRTPFAPLIPGVKHIRYNDCSAAEAAITIDTAAVIIELIQGEGGVHVASNEFVETTARLCQQRGALLIIDEVQTGFGRTGRLFACEYYQMQPDILCMAKALAGGVPIGAIGLGPRVMESQRLSNGMHSSTFGGNPLACAAALVTLQILEREALAQRAAELGEMAMDSLQSLSSPLIKEVRGKGLLIGIELTVPVRPFLQALMQRNILALQAGPKVLRLLPPLVITKEQLSTVLETLRDLLTHEFRQ